MVRVKDREKLGLLSEDSCFYVRLKANGGREIALNFLKR